MNRLFSRKIWSAALIVSGGATAYGGLKHLHNGTNERRVPLLQKLNGVLENRFVASCVTRVGYGSDGKVTPADMMLYWGSGSPFAWRVMITLEEKGLSGYKNKLLSMGNKEHKTDEMLALNPRGQIPTFKHGGVFINESLAACEFLESIYNDQGTRLMPNDPGSKAVVLQKYHESHCLLKKGVENLMFYMLSSQVDEELLKSKKEDFLKELQYWEDFLAKGEAPYLGGKEFSLADVSVFPLLAILTRFGLQLDPKFPHLAKYYKVVSQRPSVQATWPPHWKESPPKYNILADL